MLRTDHDSPANSFGQDGGRVGLPDVVDALEGRARAGGNISGRFIDAGAVSHGWRVVTALRWWSEAVVAAGDTRF